MSDVNCAHQLVKIAALIMEGQIKLPPIQVLPLEQAAQAHQLIQEGHTRGKIVLQVADI